VLNIVKILVVLIRFIHIFQKLKRHVLILDFGGVVKECSHSSTKHEEFQLNRTGIIILFLKSRPDEVQTRLENVLGI